MVLAVFVYVCLSQVAASVKWFLAYMMQASLSLSFREILGISKNMVSYLWNFFQISGLRFRRGPLTVTIDVIIRLLLVYDKTSWPFC